MPVPQQFARGDRMGRGPYEKSGMLEDTALPPHKPVEERFDVIFPEGVTELDVNVKLWYLPYGTKESDPFIWRDVTKTIRVSSQGN